MRRTIKCLLKSMGRSSFLCKIRSEGVGRGRTSSYHKHLSSTRTASSPGETASFSHPTLHAPPSHGLRDLGLAQGRTTLKDFLHSGSSQQQAISAHRYPTAPVLPDRLIEASLDLGRTGRRNSRKSHGVYGVAVGYGTPRRPPWSRGASLFILHKSTRVGVQMVAKATSSYSHHPPNSRCPSKAPSSPASPPSGRRTSHGPITMRKRWMHPVWAKSWKLTISKRLPMMPPERWRGECISLASHLVTDPA